VEDKGTGARAAGVRGPVTIDIRPFLTECPPSQPGAQNPLVGECNTLALLDGHCDPSRGCSAVVWQAQRRTIHQSVMENVKSDGAAVGGKRERLPALDALDLRILRLLSENARLSIRGVAREVGMSAPSVAERISRLEESGAIRGYRAIIDPIALDAPLLVYVGAIAIQGTDQQKVVEALRELVEVEDVRIVTGAHDMLIRLRLRDTEHLRECLFERIWNIKGLERTETYVGLDEMEPKNYEAGVLTELLAEAEAER
jgi:Lrp/AsnC family leucine-responsive transcriptional regulator